MSYAAAFGGSIIPPHSVAIVILEVWFGIAQYTDPYWKFDSVPLWATLYIIQYGPLFSARMSSHFYL